MYEITWVFHACCSSAHQAHETFEIMGPPREKKPRALKEAPKVSAESCDIEALRSETSRILLDAAQDGTLEQALEQVLRKEASPRVAQEREGLADVVPSHLEQLPPVPELGAERRGTLKLQRSEVP